MPIHDWPHAPPGYFHHFHQFWSVAICDSLNNGRLPKGYFALVEQSAIGLVPDVLTLQQSTRASAPAGRSPARRPGGGGGSGGGLAVADVPPQTRFVSRADENVYAAKANRIAVRESHGGVVAVIEI